MTPEINLKLTWTRVGVAYRAEHGESLLRVYKRGRHWTFEVTGNDADIYSETLTDTAKNAKFFAEQAVGLQT